MIDQDLYSRQIYVIGSQAMVKLAGSRVFLHGLGALGIEIAKNLILAGIGSLTLVDNKLCTMDDVGSQFYINENHVKTNSTTRVEASFEELNNLNPYVKLVSSNSTMLSDKQASDADLEQFVKQFDIVVLTDLVDMKRLIKLNELCRINGIKFLFGDVHGLFGWCFTDFGTDFEVVDVDGEEYEPQFVSKISNEPMAKVEVIDGKHHNLQDNDYVQFSELNGMNELNGQLAKVSVISSRQFNIHIDTSNYGAYKDGGVFKRVKMPKRVCFESLLDQLAKPELIMSDLDEKAFNNPYLTHVGLLALHDHYEQSQSSFIEMVRTRLVEFKKANSLDFLNENELEDTKSSMHKYFMCMYHTSRAKLPTLCAIYGGIMAQEVIKSISGKFMPIKQWLHLDVSNLYEPISTNDAIDIVVDIKAQGDRYDVLRHCFGGDITLKRLMTTRLFMVGCGAIGCELLKNFALLGISSDKSKKGLITITDNDLIEKSNLNRQFLFRKEDIQKSKSLVASQAIVKMNESVQVRAHDKKLCSQTENDIFTDAFYASNDVCVNALDNVEARRYMDSRCVSNQKPLIESGTLGPKGHVQVILPHLTESYTSQQDPQTDQQNSIPYCTLKSFPANIEHCIEWSRDKFESLFSMKPTHFDKFFAKLAADNQLETRLIELISELKTNEDFAMSGIVQACKTLKNFCLTYDDCLIMARNKFEKYFANKAKDLLYLYPTGHLMSDGSLFWKLPRRQPKPVEFDANNKLHSDFIRSCARLLADIYGVAMPAQVKHATDDQFVELMNTTFEANSSKLIKWKPNANKKIETDETKTKKTTNDEENTTNETESSKSKDFTNTMCAEVLEKALVRLRESNNRNEMPRVQALFFEKDDDTNGHIDFIYSVANLRASMYLIESSNRLHIKRIAGRIVPAIATTTSCIAGYATIELVKLIQQLAINDQRTKSKTSIDTYDMYSSLPLNKFRNYFISLAISLFVFSEPGVCPKQKIIDNVYVSLWDKWSINGKLDFTLKHFIDAVKEKYKLTVSGVIYGTKAIYMPVMPGHAKRLNEKMLKLVKGIVKLEPKEKAKMAGMYADLFLTYQECDENESDRNKNNVCPPIRYYFNRS